MSWRRVRVERGIHLLPNGKYAVSARRAGRLWSRTVGTDLAVARRSRQALIESIEAGREPSSPRLRFGTVADQVSRILGLASVTITLDVYTDLFDHARHNAEMRALMTASAFAGLLDATSVRADAA